VDDGSTDHSTAIAQSYAEQYPGKIFYLEHEGHQNRGMSATRNLGIQHAQGEYVAFLDADDVWLPHKLQDQVAILEAHPDVAMVYGRTQYWHSWMGEQNSFKEDSYTLKPGIEVDRVVQSPIPLILHLKNDAIYPCTCSILLRRQVFETVGMFEEEFRDANEDMVFHAKLFLKKSVFISSQCWDRYRQHPDSFWTTAKRNGFFKDKGRLYSAKLIYLNWLLSYMKENSLYHPDVERAIQNALWPYQHPALYAVFWYLVLQPYYFFRGVARVLIPVSHRDWLGSTVSQLLRRVSFWRKYSTIRSEVQ
jgi:glycosyltransferase involved in cell wall biosynthesis